MNEKRLCCGSAMVLCVKASEVELSGHGDTGGNSRSVMDTMMFPFIRIGPSELVSAYFRSTYWIPSMNEKRLRCGSAMVRCVKASEVELSGHGDTGGNRSEVDTMMLVYVLLLLL